MSVTIVLRASLPFITWVVVATFLVGFALYSGQDVNWDLRNYHLYAPYAFLNDRHLLDLSPAGLQSYFNPFLYLGNFWLVENFSPKAVASIQACIQSLNFLLVYFIAAELLRESPNKQGLSLSLAFMGILSVGFLSEVGSSQLDNVVSIFTLAPLMMLIRLLTWPQGRAPLYWTFVAGLLAGIGCALKLVIGTYALGLVIALLTLQIPLRERITLSAIYSFGVIIGLLLCGGYWYSFLWSNFGSPIFPLFNSIFEGELAQTSSSRDLRYLPISLFDYLAYPIVFTLDPFRVSEVAYTQYSWVLIYFLIIFFLGVKSISKIRKKMRRRKLSSAEQFFILYFIASFLIWTFLFGIYRYLISLEVLIPLLAFVLVNHLNNKHGSNLVCILILILLTAVNSFGIADWGRTEWGTSHFSVERPESIDDADTILLVGMPMGWMIPALDTNVPFTQIVPNYPVSKAYVERARERVASSAHLALIYDPEILDIEFEFPIEIVKQYFPQGMIDSMPQSRTALQLFFGMSINDFECAPLKASMGAAAFEYEYCVLKS